MLKLFFSTVAILPIAILPWISSQAETLDVAIQEDAFKVRVSDPNIAAIEACKAGQLPIFFQEQYVTTHSAEFIQQGLEAAKACDDVTITIVPILPKDAQASDIADSVLRTVELASYIDEAVHITDQEITLHVAKTAREDEITTLYINGRAAILNVDATG